MTTFRRRAAPPALVLALILAACGQARAEDAAPSDEKDQAAALIAAFKDKDLATRIEAVEAAAQLQHASLTPALIRLLADKELGVREAAIEALGARTADADRKKAAVALAARLGKLDRHPADREELMLTIQGLASLRQRSTIKALLDPIALETDLEQVEARVMAVAEVPHGDAVEALIDFLAKGRRGGRQRQRGLAHKALRILTGQKDMQEHATAGHDADRWRAWWKDNQKLVDLEAVAAARHDAAAEKEAQAEKKRQRAEERKKAREDRKKKGDGGSPRTPKGKEEAPID